MPLTPPFLKVRVRKPQFTITPRDLPEPLSPVYCFGRFSGGLAEEGCTQHLAQRTPGERVTHQGSRGTQEPPKGPRRTAGPAREKGVSCWGHWAPTSPPHPDLSRADPGVAACGLGPLTAHPAVPGGDPRPEPHRATSSLWAHLELSPNPGPAETRQNCRMMGSDPRVWNSPYTGCRWAQQ